MKAKRLSDLFRKVRNGFDHWFTFVLVFKTAIWYFEIVCCHLLLAFHKTR